MRFISKPSPLLNRFRNLYLRVKPKPSNFSLSSKIQTSISDCSPSVIPARIDAWEAPKKNWLNYDPIKADIFSLAIIALESMGLRREERFLLKTIEF